MDQYLILDIINYIIIYGGICSMKIKKIGLLLVLITMIFCLGGCLKEKETDALKFKNEYESLNGEESKSGKVYPEVLVDEDNIIEYVSLKEAAKLIDEETGVFYFGYASCPWCRNAVNMLLKAADSTDIDKIYYIDMEDMRDTKEVNVDGEVVTTKEGGEGYNELLKVLDSILLNYTIKDKDGNEVDAGEKRIYVPLVVFVVEGEIIDYHLDTVSSQTDPYVELNEEQQIELFNIYADGIHDVLGDVCEEEEHC